MRRFSIFCIILIVALFALNALAQQEVTLKITSLHDHVLGQANAVMRNVLIPHDASDSVAIEKVEGPGQITRIDGEFVWQWQPAIAEIGRTLTIKIRGRDLRTNRYGSAQFTIAVTH
jgi:hypothetical protein